MRVQVSVMLLGAPWLSASCIKYASVKEAGKITFDMDATCDAYIKTVLNIMSPGARQAMSRKARRAAAMAQDDVGGVQGRGEQLLWAAHAPLAAAAAVTQEWLSRGHCTDMERRLVIG